MSANVLLRGHVSGGVCRSRITTGHCLDENLDRCSPRNTAQATRTTSRGARDHGQRALPCLRDPKHHQRPGERRDKIKRADPASDALQRRIRAAREYVRAYRRRGTVVPADACDRCECDLRPTALRDARPIDVPLPGSEANSRELAWLCIASRGKFGWRLGLSAQGFNPRCRFHLVPSSFSSHVERPIYVEI